MRRFTETRDELRCVRLNFSKSPSYWLGKEVEKRAGYRDGRSRKMIDKVLRVGVKEAQRVGAGPGAVIVARKVVAKIKVVLQVGPKKATSRNTRKPEREKHQTSTLGGGGGGRKGKGRGGGRENPIG